MIDWLIHTRAGFLARLTAGVLFFLVLAIRDLRKNGRSARRWREYVFLLMCVSSAIVYGVLNDQISSRISWEYFYFGKELYKVLGPATPPDPLRLSLEAAKIGVMATWSFGLILGVAVLIANNPRKGGPPPLPYSTILRLGGPVLLITITFAVAGAALGWLGLLNWISADFADLWRENYFRPRRFLCAWGEHLGGYVGGIIAGVFAVAQVLRLRRR